jgi:hypothetical protein
MDWQIRFDFSSLKPERLGNYTAIRTGESATSE